MTKENIVDLVWEFADGVAGQTEAIRAGDPKKGNRLAKRYIRAFEKLARDGDRGRDALAELFSCSRLDVRVMAAAFLLRRTKEALAILEEAAAGQGMVAFGAGQTLKRWKEGSWDLDRGDGSVPPSSKP